MEKVIWITQSDYREVIRLDSDYGNAVPIVYKIIPDSDDENSNEEDLENDAVAVVSAQSCDITI
jgi:hypothetical protein